MSDLFGMNDFFSYVLRDIDSKPRSERLFEITRRHVDYKIRHRVIARANDRLIDPQFGRMFLAEKDRSTSTSGSTNIVTGSMIL